VVASRSLRGLFAPPAAALALLLATPIASANFVYWTSGSPNSSIARAKLNGTGLNTQFIGGLNSPRGVATDSRFIYWTQGDATNGSIGRANLDGSGANAEFIPHSAGVGAPSGIAVTPGAIYWQHDGTAIGRANIDGTAPNPVFIAATNSNCGLTADSNFLYYLNTGGTQIGRATLAAGAATPDFASIPEAFCGLAVDVNYLYWASDGGNTVGRVPVVGGTPEAAFIDAGTAGGGPSSVAVNPQFVFWGNYDNDVIGRANVNGAGRNPTLIGTAGVTGPADPSQLAVAPSNKITLNWVTRNRKRGTAEIVARVPGPGRVSLDEIGTPSDAGASAASVRGVSLDLPRAETFVLAVKPTGKTARKLKRRVAKKGKGRVGVSAFIHFIPAGVAGVPNSLAVPLTLKMKGTRAKKAKKPAAGRVSGPANRRILGE
jgi:hypothetical protein